MTDRKMEMTDRKMEMTDRPSEQDQNCKGNCPACIYSHGPTGTEGCKADPRELCYELMITRNELASQIRSKSNDSQRPQVIEVNPKMNKITIEFSDGAKTVFDNLNDIEVKQDRPVTACRDLGGSIMSLTPDRTTVIYIMATSTKKPITPNDQKVKEIEVNPEDDQENNK